MKLSFAETLHMRHRFWRCRFKSEAPSIRFILDSDFAGGTLLDVGANKGVFSYYMSRAAGPAGTVYAFEAQPELGPHLEGETAGSGMASFHHGGEGAVDLEEIEIPVTTLDEYLGEVGRPPVRFIKCDVEGHELEVFRGAEETLRRDGPQLLFECHHAEAEDGRLFDFLTGLGYDGTFFHVDPADHRSLLRRTRGRYVHFSEFGRYPYARPAVRHRNYLFARDLRPFVAIETKT
jgi:hypothetical protein